MVTIPVPQTRRFVSLLGTGLALGVTLVMLAAPLTAAAADDHKFTSYNLWYEHPEKVYSTGYEKGTMIPAGSAVSQVKVSRKGISFADESGTRFTVVFVAKHHPGLNSEQFADRLFTSKSLAELTKGMSAKEVEAIKKGEVHAGMSKAAVLAAVGYPPEIRTPKTDLDTWTYWRDRFRTYTVAFADGKVQQSGQ
jgi:hypothetical protein